MKISFVRPVKISNLYLKIRDKTYNDNRKFNTISQLISIKIHSFSYFLLV